LGYKSILDTAPDHSSRDDDAGAVKIVLSDEKRKNLISAFVDDLYKEIGMGALGMAGRARIIAQVPALLRVFSFKLEIGASSLEMQDAMNFLRQQHE
jgi:hypothetical protein